MRLSENGTTLDAEFGAELANGHATVVSESRSGDGRNRDYNQALELLLRRLQSIDAVITSQWLTRQSVVAYRHRNESSPFAIGRIRSFYATKPTSARCVWR